MKTYKQQEKRKIRIRSKIKGTEARPRLSVFRSNTETYVQLIDDEKGKTIISISEKHIQKTGTKTERAKQLGLLLGKQAQEKKIKKAIFDRGSYVYHGRVKAVADGAREGGLEF